jgi:hypothetical protein
MIKIRKEKNMKIRWFVLLILLVLLTACDSGGNVAPTTTPPTAPTATALPPTATPLPPTPTPTPILPTATPVSPTPTTASSAATGACNNPYYPVKANAQWKYRVTYQTGGLAPSEFTQSYTNITANGFTERRVFPNLTVENGWTCSSEGLLAAQFANLNTGGPSQFKFETLKSSGVTVPAAATLKVGATWNNGYEVKAQISTGNTTNQAQGKITQAHKIVGQESVTVPAGTYNAFKVETDFSMALSIVVGGVTVPTNFNFKVTSWFAPNVGLVKSVTASEALAATTELQSLTQ